MAINSRDIYPLISVWCRPSSIHKKRDGCLDFSTSRVSKKFVVPNVKNHYQ